MGTVKALGIDAALRVAEIENIRDGVGPKSVGPDGRPAHQIGRSFHDHQLARWASEIEAELAAGEAEIWSRGDDRECRVSFPDRAEVKIRHIEIARAVHCHAAGTIKPRGASR